MKSSIDRLLSVTALTLISSASLADSLTQIMERGTLRIGVSEFHPWTYGNQQGELEGFEIDVASRVTAALGVDPEFVIYQWDEIIDGLEANEIDVIAAGMAITPFRASRVDFSDPYSESRTNIVVNRGAISDPLENIRALDDEAYSLAIVEATLSAEAAQLLFDRATLEHFVDAQEAEAAVLSGRVHAYMTSAPEANLLVAEYPDQLELPLAEPLPGSPAGFAVQPGNESLLDFLNQWIADAEVEAWLETAYADWFIGSPAAP